MTTRFATLKLYTFKRNNNAFHTATIFKDGKEHGTMNEKAAAEYCQKWNGRRGDFEIKT